MPAAAITAQNNLLAPQVNGGIGQAMKDAVSLQLKAVRGYMQLLYWLVKREIPHTRKYASLLALVKI